MKYKAFWLSGVENSPLDDHFEMYKLVSFYVLFFLMNWIQTPGRKYGPSQVRAVLKGTSQLRQVNYALRMGPIQVRREVSIWYGHYHAVWRGSLLILHTAESTRQLLPALGRPNQYEPRETVATILWLRSEVTDITKPCSLVVDDGLIGTCPCRSCPSVFICPRTE